MPFRQSGSVRYFMFDSIDQAGALNATVTRRGGVSPSPWDSLNVGATVGDDPQRVLDNRWRTFLAVKRPFTSVFDVWQVHGTEVVCSVAPRPLEEKHRMADAILTNRPEVTLFMRFADCVPIFLYDPFRQVVGLVHAGWQGTVKRVITRTIKTMQEHYGSQPKDILAGIGPSIGPDHYEVGEDVSEQVRDTFGKQASLLLQSCKGGERDSRVKFDLWSANRLLLERAGVEQIEVSGICTACHLEDWYSHRAENGKTGRFGAVIGLR